MTNTILCIDDEADILDALERVFRQKFQILRAQNATEALEKLAQNRVGVILCDQRMPGKTGVEILRESQKIQPDAVRILLTGYADMQSVIEAVNAGQIYRYLSKPWDPVDLVATVEQALAKFNLQDDLRKKTIELEKAFSDLQSLDIAKTEFMILINHELKTPLTNLISYMEFLTPSLTSNEQRQYALRMQKAIDRLEKLINDSLTYTSIASKQRTFHPQRIQLASFIHDNFNSMIAKLGCDVVGPDASIMFDRLALTEVLSRIFENMLKHREGGHSCTLKIQEHASDVVLECENPSQGDSPRQKLGSPFVMKGNIMNHSGGNGLGLAIANVLMHSLRGDLSAKLEGGRFITSLKFPAS